MAVDRVLIQRNQQVDPVPHVGYWLQPRADRKKGVAAANDRLIGVVRIQMQPTAAEDLREDIAGRCDALSGCASDADGKGPLHRHSPSGDRFPRCSLPAPEWFAPD